ncbi:MAG TPA: EamA family transporter, partial [Limnobacter sp.]|nr:EamA family transporter [Limnobacter sp.]
AGVLFALASGCLASGIGYAVWYKVLPALPTTSAASVQLSVPVIAALAGVVFLNEAVTATLLVAMVMTLGGVYLVLRAKR